MVESRLDIESLCQKIKYTFRDISLLEEALTHSSFSHGAGGHEDYERLEFLGDAVLMLVITEWLIKEFAFESEGDLAKRRAVLVSRDVLFALASKIGIAPYIKMSFDEKRSGGDQNPNVLEDVLEAVIGAIYLDSGLDTSKKFITDHWLEVVHNQGVPPVEAKSTLQEWSQHRHLGIPQYEVINKAGEDHKPIFTIKVSLSGIPSFIGKGESKKYAEKEAAQMMLEYIKANEL